MIWPAAAVGPVETSGTIVDLGVSFGCEDPTVTPDFPDPAAKLKPACVTEEQLDH